MAVHVVNPNWPKLPHKLPNWNRTSAARHGWSLRGTAVVRCFLCCTGSAQMLPYPFDENVMPVLKRRVTRYCLGMVGAVEVQMKMYVRHAVASRGVRGFPDADLLAGKFQIDGPDYPVHRGYERFDRRFIHRANMVEMLSRHDQEVTSERLVRVDEDDGFVVHCHDVAARHILPADAERARSRNVTGGYATVPASRRGRHAGCCQRIRVQQQAGIDGSADMPPGM